MLIPSGSAGTLHATCRAPDPGMLSRQIKSPATVSAMALQSVYCCYHRVVLGARPEQTEQDFNNNNCIKRKIQRVKAFVFVFAYLAQ